MQTMDYRRKSLVATDIALAHIKEIEKNELIAKWLEEGSCTPPNLEQNTNSSLSPIFKSFIKKDEESSSPVLFADLKKSPVIKCKKKLCVDSEIGSLREISSNDRNRRYSSWVKSDLHKPSGLSNLQKSPTIGKAHIFKKKHGIKRKRLQDQFDFVINSLEQSCSKKNEQGNSCRVEKRVCQVEESEVTQTKSKITTNFDDVELKQNISDAETITASPRIRSLNFVLNEYQEKDEGDTDLFSSVDQAQVKIEDIKKEEEELQLTQNYEYCSSSIFGSALKTRRNSNFNFIQREKEISFDFIIEDTEYLIPSDNLKNRRFPDRNHSKKQNDKFLLLDSEFGNDKRKLITDTECIDYDSSSENEKETDSNLRNKTVILEDESDSDKTVSDLIEEPLTQICTEPAAHKKYIASKSFGVSSPPNSRTAASPKISNTMSPINLISPEISVNNISIETTPPRTQESLAPVPEIFDSGKKKKFKPKKGSLAARLQKLISGQVSTIRLWRHQMTQEYAFERSSAPCTTLVVVDAWTQYGKNLYNSKVINDPYNLLNDCFEGFNNSKASREHVDRNLVVMISPDFVGTVKLLPGAVFKIYLPWDIFNRNSNSGNLILHALYFIVISNSSKMKLESNSCHSQVLEHSNVPKSSKIVREYNCPCLQNGKIDDSCLNKFTNHTIDIIAELIKE